ncbi:MFS transporter, partial [Leucobacter sp. M11]|uniref:MFS transporter n=1 Tax=Leucobacter sp. M11 TaxID=2993565 RepID=UPI002D7E5119
MTPFLFLASSGLSLLGNSIAAIVLPIVVLNITGSVLAAGTLSLATAAPGFLIGLIAGVLLDRVNRRTVSIASDLISAAALAALPLTAAWTELTLGWFILFGFLGAFGDIPGMTARDTMLPAIAREARISPERLIGIGQGLSGLMVVIGPAAAGTLFLLFDGIGALWVTAATSALAALLTLGLPRRVGHGVSDGEGEGSNADAALGPVAQLLAGWRLLFGGSPVIWRIVLLGLIGMGALIAFQGSLLPAHFALGGSPEGLGFALSGFALGSMLGGGLFAAVGARGSRAGWLAVGSLGGALAIVALAFLPPLGLLVGIMGLGGALLSLQAGVSTAILLEQVPDHMRGRIMGTQNALLLVVGPLSVFGTAAAAEAWGLVPAGLGLATIALLATLAWLV